MVKKKTDKHPKKAAEAKKMKPVKTKLSKSQVLEALAEDSGMPKSEVKKVWGSLCLLYTSPSPRDATLSRMPSSA